MVEKIKNKKIHFETTTGPIRLHVDDLVSFLSNTNVFESTTFSATNNGYKFDSVDDMKTNRELLTGRPTIYGTFDNSSFHDFSIEFGEGAKINADAIYDEKHIAILNKASTNINSHRGPLSMMRFFSPFLASALVYGIFGAVILILAVAIKGGEGNEFINSSYFKTMCVLFLIALLRLLLSNRKSIYLGEKSKVWEKIKENTLSHIVVFALGIGLTWLAAKIGIVL